MIAHRFVAGVEEPVHASLHRLALEVLAKAGERVRLVDDVEAEALFEEAAAPLLAMEQELIELQIDPEVPGLRSPERFLDSAFRLQRNLSEALLSAETFLERSLSGATEFYAKPPNFAHPELIAATKNEHRSALAVSAQELQRQYRRELDLAKLLAQLFRAYARLLRERGCAPGRDLVAWALDRVRNDTALAETMRSQYALAFIGEAQELTIGESTLLQAIFGTVERSELKSSPHPRPRIETFRPATQAEEAHWIAARVAGLLKEGARPREVAVLLRSVSGTSVYEEALLDRNVPVQIAGNYNPFADRRALDALALLWNVQDPFRHEWLLRTLEGRALALSDASLATLCGDSTERQTALFEEAAPTDSAHRDPERSVRLGRNVLSSECDHALSPLARERVERFRAMRERWAQAQSLAFEEFAQLVWSEGLAREGAPDSARALAQQRVLRLLLARMSAYLAVHPGSDLGAVLADSARRAQSDLESCQADPDEEAVLVASVEAVRGRSFEHVIVANVRPGAFPRWYAADVFHFSQKLGVIPRDNVGDAPTARTAKFTYYVHAAKAREKYNARDRRLFEFALGSARSTLCVTAWGRPTRAVSAPEFLEELR